MVFFVILASSFIPCFDAFGQSSNDTDVKFTKEFLTLSANLIQNYVEQGQLDDAKNISKIVSEVFPHSLSSLRQYDSETADEIHLLLLDIHSQIDGDQEILKQDFLTLTNILDKLEPKNPNIGKVISKLLTVVDEQYQHAITENSESSYTFSILLVDLSSDLFEFTNYDERLTLEVRSFLDELKIKIVDKESFVSVGTLISAIHRDLNGTETVIYDKQNIYNTIYKLYDELIVSIESADYQRAEELAIEAYLENFEYLEADIELADSELLYKLEIDMREELRQMIQNKQDSERIFTSISFLLI